MSYECEDCEQGSECANATRAKAGARTNKNTCKKGEPGGFTIVRVHVVAGGRRTRSSRRLIRREDKLQG
jgi:hypothetical protein